ncbi:UNVERIFIED_CONTAM: hypothetical protein K2H54_040883 [Gekko kuhli]
MERVTQKMSGLQFNLGPAKEPLGFIKALEWDPFSQSGYVLVPSSQWDSLGMSLWTSAQAKMDHTMIR